jgi:hypothetical protein
MLNDINEERIFVNKSIKNNDLLNLFKTSFVAQRDYISSHIQNDINSLYFTYSCGLILDLLDEATSIDELIYGFLLYSQDIQATTKSGFFVNPLKYRKLAVNTALDICNSFKRRFQ